MAAGVHSNFTIYDRQFNTGRTEQTAQNLAVIGAASGGTIVANSERHEGAYNKQTFMPRLSSAVGRRDLTSLAAQTDTNPSNTEIVGVKLHRKFVPVAQTLASWQDQFGGDPAAMRQAIGRWYQAEKEADMLNTAVLALEAALQDTDATYDATSQSTTTLTATHLASGINKLGDQAKRVGAFLTYSKPDNDLLKQAISDKVTNIADMAIRDGSTPYLGRRSLVSDIPALTDANGSLTDTYNVLGLVPGALTMSESIEEQVAFDLVTGLEQLVYRFQAEYTFTVKIKGFTWDVTNGGSNPTDANLATASNWDQVASDIKDGPGVRVVVQ